LEKLDAIVGKIFAPELISKKMILNQLNDIPDVFELEQLNPWWHGLFREKEDEILYIINALQDEHMFEVKPHEYQEIQWISGKKQLPSPLKKEVLYLRKDNSNHIHIHSAYLGNTSRKLQTHEAESLRNIPELENFFKGYGSNGMTISYKNS